MRLSKGFVPTLREAPADAQVVSHKLLVRAGFIRQLGAGIYSYLPLALRSLRKVEAIIREEMAALGAQEFYLPALHPAEVWQESGRWDAMGANMFRLTDRRGGAYGLGMTHEEVFTAIARADLRSYRELPQIWYQIQSKFRDELRPKSGLLRVRQFTMKDAYSFDVDAAGLDRAFALHREAYHRILSRCGLTFVAVDADAGAMGGSESTEFMVRTDAGEDLVAACPRCGYAANTEKATGRVAPEVDGPGQPAPERVATCDVPASRQLTTRAFVAGDALVLAVVRGDHALNEVKLQAALGAVAVRPAHPDEIVARLGVAPGSLGAVGTAGRCRVLLDRAVLGRREMVTGANEDGYHLRGVDVDRDLAHAEPADLRTVQHGDGCSRCDGALEVFKGLEVGHIFKLGTRYSERMGARVAGVDGASVPLVMGSYGIGVERVMAAAVELHHDGAGIRWPLAIAPYHVALLALQADTEVTRAAEALYAALTQAGVEVLYDDRDERAGVKLADADLLGLPIRIAVGRRSLARGGAEWKLRSAPEAEVVALPDLVPRACAALEALRYAAPPAGRD